MELTKDVVRDLVRLLTEQGFSEDTANDIILLASFEVTWAVNTISKAIMRATSTKQDFIAI